MLDAMRDVVRQIDEATNSNVTSDDDRSVQVTIGEGADTVTLVGSLPDLQRLIINLDNRLSRLTRPRFNPIYHDD